jgi:hypothetical protein
MNTTKKLIVLLAAALGACGADTSGIVIRGRAASTSEAAEGCSFAPGGEFQLGGGRLDLGPGGAGSYALPLYIKNTLTIPAAPSGAAQSEQKTWFAKSARVRVRPGNAGATYTLAPIAVAAGGGESANSVDIIQPDLAAQLLPLVGTRIVVDITLEGETQDGEELDTNEFSYPIDLCTGCATAPACAAGEVLTPTACGYIGQDSPPVCVAAAAATP